MKKSLKVVLIGFAVVAVVVIFIVVKNLTAVNDFHNKYEGYDLATDVDGVDRAGTYTEYISGHDAVYPKETVMVDLMNYVSGEDVEEYQNFEGENGALYTGDTSDVTWEIEIPESGFYNVYLEYMTVESRGVEIERTLFINDELPFEDAAALSFTRIWTDAAEAKTDNQGNEIRPMQIEKYEWQNAYCRDDMGYVTEPYQFYFEKGANTITLKTVNEPMVLRKLELTPVQEMLDYEEYCSTQTATENNDLDYIQKIQGEDATARSESSLYAKYDRSSPSTQPYSVMHTVLNYTGGDAWSKAGQWIEWEFEVPEDGYYNITIKGRQNYARGSISCRRLYLDGEVPFSEMESIQFKYDNDWQLMTLSNDDGEAYEFYLTAGTHQIRLEATLGDTGAILTDLEDSTYRLNQMYRKILVYTGATPDQFRDYNINQVYPEVIEAMSLESKRLYQLVDETTAYMGQKSDKIATAQTLAQQLETFVEKPYKITLMFQNFKDNITALGTAILNMSETKLDIDYIEVSSANTKIPSDKTYFYQKAWHEVKSFVASFLVDYNAVGDVYGDEKGVVTVWIVTGRDQGTILKTMVDDTFTPDSGIGVNVEIVDASALLSAVVAGNGPDVVLSVGADQPVNYALRNAAEDLTQFEGWEEVFSHYYESAYRAYEYNDGIYAIPETQTYNVLFYRTDIMEELGLEIPQTWDDLINLFPTIQGNNMEIGIPDPTSATFPDISVFYTLLYQSGSDVYDEMGTRTIVDNERSVDAFSRYTQLYTDYGTPVYYDFVSRFRSGQMPIGVANYTLFNTLVVSAPEIRGLWDFTLVPGTERTDAEGNTYIDRSEYSTGTCTMMLKNDDELTKNNTWEFMKWWASSDSQVRFARELEALLGSSARYATANVDAFEEIAWSADDADILREQWKSTVGFREVAGGYYTNRHIINAVRKLINEKIDPREVIMDYAITINEELEKKRKEFGITIE